MKKYNVRILILLAALFLGSCGDETGVNMDIQEASSEKQFVWDAMNFWYFWQEDVPELADDKSFFENEQDFQDFLMSFPDAEALFNELIFSPEDEFSFFIEDFEEFMQARQGISKDFGFEFGLVQISNSNDIFGYIQFVLPDSPGENAGLARGDIFTKVNGTQLTVNNFRDVLDSETFELTMAEIQNGTLEETGETITVQAATLQGDPVFLSTVIDTSSTKIGYLKYNAFQTNSHEKLNEVFGNFANEGIDDLVLDLRYNGGGAVITSAALATMISGMGSSDVYAELTFNSKRSAQNQPTTFLDQLPLFNDNGEQESETSINTLSMDRVFVLTGPGTASASEAVINGLEPFIEVIVIGRNTVGKDEGSITLFDAPSPFTEKESANPNHRIAIQPIVFKIVNALGEDYPTGFQPDFQVNEVDFLENLPPLGDPSEPLLAEALEQITGTQMAKEGAASGIYQGQFFGDSRDLKPQSKRMYVLPEQIKNQD